MAYYLGIDGGGSKTTCVLGDEDLQLGIATVGPSNITRVGVAGAREALHHAIREACVQAKVDPKRVLRACVGAAGAGRDDVADTVRKIVAEVIPGEIEVVGDMEVALAAAFGSGFGIVVIAGTGSIAYGRDEHGKTARVGGWGFAISDEGSAHWIGRTAVSSLMHAIDKGTKSSALDRELIRAKNLSSLNELVLAANSTADLAVFFPAVLAAEQAGDDLAKEVLQKAGAVLAELTSIVSHRLFGDEPRNPSVPVAMVGGVFRHSHTVREVFCNELRNLNPYLNVIAEIVEPVAGALQLARGQQ